MHLCVILWQCMNICLCVCFLVCGCVITLYVLMCVSVCACMWLCCEYVLVCGLRRCVWQYYDSVWAYASVCGSLSICLDVTWCKCVLMQPVSKYMLVCVNVYLCVTVCVSVQSPDGDWEHNGFKGLQCVWNAPGWLSRSEWNGEKEVVQSEVSVSLGHLASL